jgi:thioredoxin reductase (NADPH)
VTFPLEWEAGRDMTSDGEPSAAPGSGLPVLFVADADDQARDATASALARRFSPDYRIVTADSAGSGLDTLAGLVRHGHQVALLAADLHLPGMGGVEFLDRAHALHRSAGRMLLVAMDRYHTRIPFSELETLRQATALGRIDFAVAKGWVTPEEWLYPQVQDALSAWTVANRPRHLIYRIVGEQWAQRSHDLRDFLTRNSIPFEFHAADSATGRRLLRQCQVDTSRLPAVIHHSGSVLQDPTDAQIATAHGITTQPSSATVDLAILGAGPAGLAAAVYGASEGLQTMVVEPRAIGGQAGTSSMIRNYLGFPRGVSGGRLAHQAWEQALLFGTEFVFTQQATALDVRGHDRVITLTDGSEVTARSVIIAVGATYRGLGIAALDRLIGAGVFYGAAGVEAPAMAGEHVYVVGGANSAGQAALHLARFARRVTLLVRGRSLAAGMSDYLVRQVAATSNLDVRLHTRVVDGSGESRLQALRLEDVQTGQLDEVAAGAVFVLIGAEPHTGWLRDIVAVDDRGFVLTGGDLPAQGRRPPRAPLPFETSVPGVFAVGDVRHGSVKRVAGAVGEGSVAVGSVHQYLEAAAVGAADAT